MFNSKAIGGILLIVGTSIGAGMLALPLALAKVGFIYSIGLLILSWGVMYLGAYFMLEVNLTFPAGRNIVSMAQGRLGWPGQVMAWVSCLCLLYSLLAGYIAGGSDVFKTVLTQHGVACPDWVSTIGFALCFGGIVYAGIRTVDYVNRGLMFAKLGVYLLVVCFITPHVSGLRLQGGLVQEIPGSLMILITSFGFASIVPSLRYYFQDDIPLLRRVIFLGSFIPLICYILWIAIIMGVIPREGDQSLMSLSQLTHPIGGVINSLETQVGVKWIGGFFSLFSAICMLTAFLGVSLGLFDFLADGLNLRKQGWQGRAVFVTTFFPPLLVVLLHPGIYLHALTYAGRFCVILLLILPCMMLYRQFSMVPNTQVWGGKISLIVVFLVAILLLWVGG